MLYACVFVLLNIAARKSFATEPSWAPHGEYRVIINIINMKTKLIKVMLLALFVFGLNVATQASNYDDLIGEGNKEEFCKYQGMFGTVDDTEKEFAMLLDSPKTATFKTMSRIVYQIYYIVSQGTRYNHNNNGHEYLEIVRDARCNVSKYTRKLLTYYEEHKDVLKDKKMHLPSNTYESFGPMMKYLKEEVGTEFLSNAPREILRSQIQSACLSSDGNPQSYDCARKTVLTVMELINSAPNENDGARDTS